MRLSFRLTRWQRVLNPVERLIYAPPMTGVLALVFICLTWEGPIKLKILMVIIGAFIFRMYGGYLASLCCDMFSDIYIDSIEIKDDLVYYEIAPSIFFFGRGFKYAPSRKMMKVEKGLCGTYVLRNVTGSSPPVVLPRTCVTHDQLKQLFS